ncbi:unnamed protein product, partial [Arabidopsis halleri]
LNLFYKFNFFSHRYVDLEFKFLISIFKICILFHDF